MPYKPASKTPSFSEWTFFKAALEGDLKAVEAMLDEYPAALHWKEDISRESGDETTALMYAAMNGHNDMIALLLKRGAGLEEIDRHHATALTHAVHAGHENTVEFLLRRGAQTDRTSYFHMQGTVMSIAMRLGRHDIVDLIKRARAGEFDAEIETLPTQADIKNAASEGLNAPVKRINPIRFR